MESYFKIFMVTMAFYFTDYIFDISFEPDITALTKTTPHLLLSMLMMGSAYVLVDLMAEKIIQQKNKFCKVEIEEVDEEVEEAEGKNEDIATAVIATADLHASLLTEVERKEGDEDLDDELDAPAGRQSFCSKLRYCFFSSTPKAMVQANAASINSAPAL
jgi:hypothetical protein